MKNQHMGTPGAEVPPDSVLRIIEAAVDLQQAGEKEKSIELLLDAQRRAPNYVPTHLLLGLAYRDAGRLEEAEARLRQAIQLNPKQAEALQALGLLLVQQHRSVEAIEVLERHVELAPEDAVTLRALSNELARARRAEEGVALLEKAWQATRNTEIGVALGRYLMRTKQPARAEEVFREVATSSPSAEPWIEWAQALLSLGRPHDALAPLERGIELAPNSDRAWRGLADAQTIMERYPEALQASERALAINDQDCRNWLVKANTLFGGRHFEEALEAARIGLSCTASDTVAAHLSMHGLQNVEVLTLLRLKRTDEALQRLEELREEYPKAEQFAIMEVQALINLDRPDEAFRILNQAQAQGIPANGNLAPLRYATLHLLGRGEEARSFIESQLAIGRESRLEILSNLGLLLYRMGKVPVAQAVFTQVSDLAPDSVQHLLRLGFVLSGDEPSVARGYLSRALQLADSDSSRALALADLAYLDLLQGSNDEAREKLTQAAQLTSADDQGILRVAHWDNGRVVPDPERYPTAFMPVQTGIKANLVTAELGRGNPAQARLLAEELIAESPDSLWGPKCLGWVLEAES
jgi:tetratricopeptide (TPR) repeat protein